MPIILVLITSCQQTTIGSDTFADVKDVGAIQVYDAFNGATIGATWTGNDNTVLSLNAGSLEVTNTSDQFVATASPKLTQTYSDVSIEVKAKWVSGIKNNGFGIHFRDSGSGKQYRFLISENGSYILTIGAVSIVDWTSSTTINKGDWNTLRIDCIGNHIVGYINGTLVVDKANSAYATGTVSLAVSDIQTVRFDDYKCWYWMRVNNGAR
jgi:hypothetical protein